MHKRQIPYYPFYVEDGSNYVLTCTIPIRTSVLSEVDEHFIYDKHETIKLDLQFKNLHI